VKSWWFSLVLLLEYLLTFALWLSFPNRTAYLGCGVLAVVLMAVQLRYAARRGYFADRSDLILHGLVIVDVALEGASYELFNTASQCIFCVPGDAPAFHNGYNFVGCATILGAFVGGYHAWALRRSHRSNEPPKGPEPTEGGFPNMNS
jgi:hypothetical protein